MSCVVGVIHDNKVWMGADRAGTSENHTVILVEPKVFKHKGLVIGCSGCFKGTQLMKYHLEHYILRSDLFDKALGDTSVEQMVYYTIPNSLSCLFREKGYSSKDLEFLIGIKGRLFAYQTDLSVLESTDKFYSVGAGSDYALGSLYTNPYEPPEPRIKRALETATHFCPSVRGPYDIIHED